MIAAGAPKAAIAGTLRVGRTTLYRDLPADSIDGDREQAAKGSVGDAITSVRGDPRSSMWCEVRPR